MQSPLQLHAHIAFVWDIQLFNTICIALGKTKFIAFQQ